VLIPQLWIFSCNRLTRYVCVVESSAARARVVVSIVSVWFRGGVIIAGIVLARAGDTVARANRIYLSNNLKESPKKS
jgi:hypothetical protein